MRILILTPSKFPEITGNAITTERWRRHLSAQGHQVKTISVRQTTPQQLQDCLKSFKPDLIHAHHAFKTSSALLHPCMVPVISSLPLIVSPGGTDLNLDFEIGERKEIISSVLGLARIILVQNCDAAHQLTLQLPELADRIVKIAKAPYFFGADPFNLRKMAECKPEDALFFLPAGIRPVKGNLECLEGMKKANARRPEIKFVAAGPLLDDEYARAFMQEMRNNSHFALWMHSIPQSSMRSAYEQSDIVMNASFSEGFSNSLLEAIATERVILASDIPGNRLPVLGEDADSPAGLSFAPGNSDDLAEKAVKLVEDKELRNYLGRSIAVRKKDLPSPEEEAAQLLAAYKSALDFNLNP